MSNIVSDFNIRDIKLFENNHRYMAKSDFAKFTASIHDFGDLAPIIINLQTRTLIGGHRRDEVMDFKNCEFVWLIEYDEPDHQGTLALGYVKYNDALYTTRLVWWDERTEAIANIASNKLKGVYDLEGLINEVDSEILKQGGFSEDELTAFNDMAQDSEDDFDDQAEDGGMDEEDDDEGISIVITVYDNFQIKDVTNVLDTHLSDFKYKVI